MRIFTNVTMSSNVSMASNAKDTFTIGSELERDNPDADNLKVWANANFYNDVTLGSSSIDIITVTGQLSASNGLSASVIYGDGSGLINIAGVNGITVQETGSGATANVTNVTTLKFDKDTGFTVQDVGGNAVKVSLGSSFKTWNVSGSDSLVAVGEDTVEFIAGDNITITTNTGSNPKSITFNAVTGSGTGISEVVTSGNITGSGTSQNNITLKDNISLTSVTASFSGDGTYITGVLTSSFVDVTSLPNFSTNVRNQLSAGQNISFSNGQFSLNNDISLNSVTASSGRIDNSLYVFGDLFVSGVVNQIDRTQLLIADSTILIASGTTDENLLDGTGIHFGSVPNFNVSIAYNSTNDTFVIAPGVSSSFTGYNAGITELPYDFFGEVYGKPAASEILFRITAPRGFQLATSGHYFYAVTGSAATANFAIRKNGTQIGTASYATSTTGTVSGITTSNNTFIAGDILTVVAPASQDTTISDLYFTLKASTT